MAYFDLERKAQICSVSDFSKSSSTVFTSHNSKYYMICMGSSTQEYEIVKAIRLKTNCADCNMWTIGITDDPKRRQTEHEGEGKNTKYWMDWKADTETIARSVEKQFLDKGMKGAPC